MCNSDRVTSETKYLSHVVLYRFGLVVLIMITAKMLFTTSKNIFMDVHVKNTGLLTIKLSN